MNQISENTHIGETSERSKEGKLVQGGVTRAKIALCHRRQARVSGRWM